MNAYSYCNARAASTVTIDTPTDLAIPFGTPSGATAVLKGTKGRPVPNLNMTKFPVLVVHHQFLLPGAAHQLATGNFDKNVQEALVREASAALIPRSRSATAVLQWLGTNFKTVDALNGRVLFGHVRRVNTPYPASKRNGRPCLYICVIAPPLGALFRSPGYPDSTIRLFPGDAVLCPSLFDETARPDGTGRVQFLQLHGDPFSRDALFTDRPPLPRPKAHTVQPGQPQPPSAIIHLDPPAIAQAYHPTVMSTAEAQDIQIRAREEMGMEYAPIIQSYEARIAELEAGLTEERAKSKERERAEERRLEDIRAAKEREAVWLAERQREAEAARSAASVSVKQERVDQGAGAPSTVRPEVIVRLKEEKVALGVAGGEVEEVEKGKDNREATRTINTSRKVKEEMLAEDADDFCIIDPPPPLATTTRISRTLNGAGHSASQSVPKRKVENDTTVEAKSGGKRRKVD